MRLNPGLKRGEGRTHRTGEVVHSAKKPASERLRELWPDIWAMVRPRRGILLLGFGLIVISRLCGLVLPASTRFLIDDIMRKHDAAKLLPLTLAVVFATIIQGVASFTLTQLLS